MYQDTGSAEGRPGKFMPRQEKQNRPPVSEAEYFKHIQASFLELWVKATPDTPLTAGQKKLLLELEQKIAKADPKRADALRHLTKLHKLHGQLVTARRILRDALGEKDPFK